VSLEDSTKRIRHEPHASNATLGAARPSLEAGVGMGGLIGGLLRGWHPVRHRSGTTVGFLVVTTILAVVIASPWLTKVSPLRPPYLAVFEIGLLLAYMGYQQLVLHRLSQDLGKRKELFRLISEHAADMIAVVDVNGRRLFNSPAYQKVLGYSPEELRTSSPFAQIHPDDQRKVMEAAEEARRTGVGKKLEYRIRHKNGTWLVLESTASAVRDERGQVVKLVIINRDITERKRAEARLEHTALHDALTDLPNRVMFRDRLQRAFERSQKNPAYKYAVLFLDIDGFKVFNDSMGHIVGDEIIVQIGRRLANCLRYEDTLFRPLEGEHPDPSVDEVLARLGGDEFTILLSAIQDPTDAMRVAHRIQEALGTFSVDGREVFISASIGIALSTTPHARAEELLRDADLAMYRAKTLGKSRCEFFDPEMHTKVVKQLDLENELRRAVSAEEFRVHYQPIVSLETMRIVGFEALVRWQRSRECMVFPDGFISIAEGIGLVVPLGKWVLHQACKQAQIWHARYPQDPPLSVTVNLSPKQFSHPHLLADIEEILKATDIAPETLHLEITESVAMADPDKTRQILAQLKAQGVQICIDDFGTGHSSLGRLRRFPVDIVKIDRSFVTHMDADNSARAIVQLIIDFAHNVNLKLIAEGIETAEQVDRLRNAHCEFGQGYFFSKAVDADAVDRLLAANDREIAAATDQAKTHAAGAP
jgi:PAS domain S-box-containing protein